MIRSFIFYLLISSGIGILAGCNNSKPEKEVNATAKTPVTIVNIQMRTLSNTIELNARTVLLIKSTVRSTISGTIEIVKVSIGDRVRSGQILFTVRTKEFSVLRHAKTTDSNLTFNGLINIYASNDGIVSSLSHQNGDFVQEGDEMTVIADPGSLVFLMDVPFEFRNFVMLNQSYLLRLPDSTTFNGTVRSSLPLVDPMSQTETFIIRPLSHIILPENLIVKVKIPTKTHENTIVLPKQVILSNETESEFWVMKLINDSTAVKVPVVKGLENNNEVEILNPLFKSTDRIILKGSYGLPDTALIRIEGK